MSTKNNHILWIGNIPFDVTEKELYEVLSKVGDVINVRIKYDVDKNMSKGFAFCEYKDIETCMLALKYVNGYELKGRKLRLYWANEENREKVASITMNSNSNNNSNNNSNSNSNSNSKGTKEINKRSNVPGASIGSETFGIDAGGASVGNFCSRKNIPNSTSPLGNTHNSIATNELQVGKETTLMEIKENIIKVNIANIIHTLTTSQILYILSYFHNFSKKDFTTLKIYFTKKRSVAYALLHCLFLLNMINEHQTINNDFHLCIDEEALLNKNERSIQMRNSNINVSLGKRDKKIMGSLKHGIINTREDFSHTSYFNNSTATSVNDTNEVSIIRRGECYTHNSKSGGDNNFSKKKNFSANSTLGKKGHPHNNSATSSSLGKSKGNVVNYGLYGPKKNDNVGHSRSYIHNIDLGNQNCNICDDSFEVVFQNGNNNGGGKSRIRKKSLYPSINICSSQMEKHNNTLDAHLEDTHDDKCVNEKKVSYLSEYSHVVDDGPNGDFMMSERMYNSNNAGEESESTSFMEITNAGVHAYCGDVVKNANLCDGDSNTLGLHREDDFFGEKLPNKKGPYTMSHKNKLYINAQEESGTREKVPLSEFTSEKGSTSAHAKVAPHGASPYGASPCGASTHEASTHEASTHGASTHEASTHEASPYADVDLPDDELVNEVIKNTDILNNILKSKAEDMRNWSDEQRIQVLSIQKALQLKGYTLNYLMGTIFREGAVSADIAVRSNVGKNAKNVRVCLLHVCLLQVCLLQVCLLHAFMLPRGKMDERYFVTNIQIKSITVRRYAKCPYRRGGIGVGVILFLYRCSRKYRQVSALKNVRDTKSRLYIAYTNSKDVKTRNIKNRILRNKVLSNFGIIFYVLSFMITMCVIILCLIIHSNSNYVECTIPYTDCPILIHTDVNDLFTSYIINSMSKDNILSIYRSMEKKRIDGIVEQSSSKNKMSFQMLYTEKVNCKYCKVIFKIVENETIQDINFFEDVNKCVKKVDQSSCFNVKNGIILKEKIHIYKKYKEPIRHQSRFEKTQKEEMFFTGEKVVYTDAYHTSQEKVVIQDKILYLYPLLSDFVLNMDEFKMYKEDEKEIYINEEKLRKHDFLDEQSVDFCNPSYKEKHGYNNLSDDLPVCANDLPVCADDLPVCANDLPVCANDLPVCADDLPVCANDLPVCADDLPVCANDVPVCANDLPVFLFRESTYFWLCPTFYKDKKQALQYKISSIIEKALHLKKLEYVQKNKHVIEMSKVSPIISTYKHFGYISKELKLPFTVDIYSRFQLTEKDVLTIDVVEKMYKAFFSKHNGRICNEKEIIKCGNKKEEKAVLHTHVDVEKLAFFTGGITKNNVSNNEDIEKLEENKHLENSTKDEENTSLNDNTFYKSEDMEKKKDTYWDKPIHNHDNYEHKHVFVEISKEKIWNDETKEQFIKELAVSTFPAFEMVKGLYHDL
ncbi:mRNA processing protein, putative [Plasmodium ovale wallikeri]|uniref:mRNA processing protein, putative n=1 Tax=Plasmodium ovale wallikeri TaxID=864142 RepID=A0A1A8YV76_PLAOA|nr:mRNA processing protein, putative [Plasmodium ovale wallikeri]